MKWLSNGIEDFKELCEDDRYYIDKLLFIKHILEHKINIVTRPRRFGKTLNMSMLYYFFNIKEKTNLFSNLKIAHTNAIKHHHQYPVIFLTFKDVQGLTFDDALDMYKFIIQDYLMNNSELLTSPRINEKDLKILNQFYQMSASLQAYQESLFILCRALYSHYHKKSSS